MDEEEEARYLGKTEVMRSTAVVEEAAQALEPLLGLAVALYLLLVPAEAEALETPTVLSLHLLVALVALWVAIPQEVAERAVLLLV